MMEQHRHCARPPLAPTMEQAGPGPEQYVAQASCDLDKDVGLLTSRRADMPGSSLPGPSEVPDIAETKTSPTRPPRLGVFAVETAALTTRTVPADHDPRGYGETGADWHPFPGQRLSLAEHVRQIAERRDFKAEVSAIKLVGDQGTNRPGIILIDPWFIADEDGRSTLQSAVQGLPRWVLPLVVVGQPDDLRTQELVGQVIDILAAAGALHTDSARRAARGVGSLDAFVSIIPGLVDKAERQYLLYRRGRVASSPTAKRPRLASPGRPDRFVSTQDPLGETSDA
jgi:FxsC-like protein